MNDQQLVRDFLNSRSEKAFHKIYQAKTPRLYQMALRLTAHDQSQAEELVQEMWVIAIRKRYGTLAMAVALTISFAAISAGNADSPFLALGLGLIAAAGALISRKLLTRVFAPIIVLTVVAMPLLPGLLPNPETETRRVSFLSPSALHRLSIWNTAADRFTERPLLGIGMNATRSLYSDKDKIVRNYYTDDPNKSWHNVFEPIPLHVHNGILQIWLELGIGGALLLVAAILSLLAKIRRDVDGPVMMAACIGLLTSATIIFSVSFGPWQNWWQAALWLTAGYMVAVQNDGASDNAG